MKDILNGATSTNYCLDHGFVQLVDCMPRLVPDEEESADHAIAEAARCSYQRGTKTIADDKTLIRYLMRHNHTSPFEMVEFKFHIKLPIFVMRQLVRHRAANLNELSGRYSEMPEEYYVPDINNMRGQSKINTQGSDGYLDEHMADCLISDMNKVCGGAFSFYKDFLEAGLVREQSRMVLPLSTYTELYWKIDLKNLLHFLDLRCDDHSQWEIQEYGKAILELIKPLVPWTIDAWEDYSVYRGGMILTRQEIENIKNIITHAKVEMHCNLEVYDLKTDSKLEVKEWEEKGKKLGIFWEDED